MALSESPAIEDLRLLLAIAETANVTQAAKLFGVSQPSITKRLKVFQGKHALASAAAKHLKAIGRDWSNVI
ncbi:MAG: LysR family transcriptional regulator [Planctomycetota bacterium]